MALKYFFQIALIFLIFQSELFHSASLVAWNIAEIIQWTLIKNYTQSQLGL